VSNHAIHIAKYTTDPEAQDGSLDNPFVNFEDALTRLDELVGYYSASTTVTAAIYLFNGEHYLLNR
jgi:hypothetical protein